MTRTRFNEEYKEKIEKTIPYRDYDKKDNNNSFSGKESVIVFVVVAIIFFGSVFLIMQTISKNNLMDCLADERHTIEIIDGSYANCCHNKVVKLRGVNAQYVTTKSCNAMPIIEETNIDNFTKDMLLGEHYKNTIASEIIANNTLRMEIEQ